MGAPTCEPLQNGLPTKNWPRATAGASELVPWKLWSLHARLITSKIDQISDPEKQIHPKTVLASLAEQILLFLRRFIVGSSVRFGLVDNWLHRTIVRWLDPELNDLIVWLTLNELNCIAEVIAATTYHPYLITYAYFIIIRTLHPFFILRDSSGHCQPGSLVVAQFAVSADGGLHRRRASASVWNLRNPSLARAFVLEIDRLKGGVVAPPGTAGATGEASSVLERERLKQSMPVVVFYSRRSRKSTRHGRVMTAEHEEQLLRVLHDTLQQHGRNERIGKEKGPRLPPNARLLVRSTDTSCALRNTGNFRCQSFSMARIQMGVASHMKRNIGCSDVRPLLLDRTEAA